jgi:apolipoprotein D and lipocalin family protein
VIELAGDYSHAVVGSPDREYLWILSRTPTLDEATYRELTRKIAEKGFDATKLIRTAHTGH